MPSETKKTPLTKPATPVSKRSGEFKAASVDDSGAPGIAAVEQWHSQRVSQIEELPESDVELVDDELEAESKGSPSAEV